ncbi:MAG: carbohydrate kinase family protein [Acidobacteria bacterium]|nr:carbohydrate kinase family protein [Acidobacteriota bacterium]
MQKKGESQRFRVVGVGENSVDLVVTVPHHPAPNEKLEALDVVALPGGQVASALVACARLGCDTRYLGSFGDDAHARLIEEALRREGVDTARCRHVRAPNRSALILVDAAAATRTVLWRRDPALDWPPEDMTSELLSEAGVLMLDATDLEAAVAAAVLARNAGVTVVADVDRPQPGLDRLLPHVDVLIAAEGFPQAMTGEASLGPAMRILRTRHPLALIVVTLGAGGAVAWNGETEIVSPGFVVPVVDPTGAGDAFRAGFVRAWLAGGRDIAGLLDHANATAALNCRAVGAQTGLPTFPEVQALVTDRAAPRSNGHGFGSERRGGG